MEPPPNQYLHTKETTCRIFLHLCASVQENRGVIKLDKEEMEMTEKQFGMHTKETFPGVAFTIREVPLLHVYLNRQCDWEFHAGSPLSHRRYFMNDGALKRHVKGKPHKRRYLRAC